MWDKNTGFYQNRLKVFLTAEALRRRELDTF